MNKQILSEEFQRMQKLAGIITETEGKSKVLSELRFIDKIKAAFGIQLKAPEAFDTKKIDGNELNPDQKEVGNTIIMTLNDMNKGMNPNNYYFTKISAIKLLDKGLKIMMFRDTYEDLDKKLKEKGLEVSTKREWYDYKQFDSDLNREIDKSSYHTIMDVTKK